MLKDGASNETLKNYSQSFSNGNITVNWQRGAKPLTFEEIKGYLEKIDPTIENNQVLIEAGEDDAGGMIMPSCLRGTTSTSCQLHIYEAGVIEKPTALAGEKLYWVFRPGSSWGGDVSFINMLALWDDVAHRFVVIQPDGLRPDAVDTRFVSGIIEYQFPELTLEREFTIPGFDGIPVVFSKSRHLPEDLGKIRARKRIMAEFSVLPDTPLFPMRSIRRATTCFPMPACLFILPLMPTTLFCRTDQCNYMNSNRNF